MKPKTSRKKKSVSQKQHLVNMIKIAISEKKGKGGKGRRRSKRQDEDSQPPKSSTRSVGVTPRDGALVVASGPSDQSLRALQGEIEKSIALKHGNLVSHLSKQQQDIEDLKHVQNGLLESALRSSVGKLQNDIASKTLTKGGSPSYTSDSAKLYASLTPSHRIKLSVNSAKEYLKAHKEFMRMKKDKKADGGYRQYTDAEIDALADPSTVTRYYRETVDTQAQRAMLATHIGPSGQLPITPVKQQLGESKITSSNGKWLEKLGMMDDTLKQMVQPDDEDDLSRVKANLFGGEGDEDDSDGYGGFA